MASSHGIPRTSEPRPKTQEALQKERERIQDYRSLVTDVNQMIRDGQRDQKALDGTSKLLKQNPEYYTIWNHRRRVLLSQMQEIMKISSSEESARSLSDLITSDLTFLFPLMQKYPKCYWLWNHRAWLLQQASSRLPVPTAIKFWTQELSLDNKMLQQDKRNFHGWGYRQRLVAELERLRKLQGASELEASMAGEEYEYTRKMIGQDLSNFSAWHARSYLILRMLREKNADVVERKAMLDSELDLIHEALIDPRDQSLWFYHQFLMTTFHPDTAAQSIAPNLSPARRVQYLEGEIEYVLEALDGAEDVKWVYLSLVQLACAYKASGHEWSASGSPDQVRTWMQELKKLDPKRANRWHDWVQTVDWAL